MNEAGRSRILFDLSTSMRYCGPPHGIVRVERQLAAWALAHRADVMFVFFDPAMSRYRRVCCDIRPFLDDTAVLNFRTIPMQIERAGHGRSWIIPRERFDQAPRHVMLAGLERARLRARSALVARIIEALQRLLISAKDRHIMLRPDGLRRAIVPYDLAVDEAVALRPDDILVCAGAPWGWVDADALADQKAHQSFRFVLLCHDLIPVLFPEFVFPAAATLFRDFMRNAFAVADRILVNSRRTEQDCRAWAGQQGIGLQDVKIVPFGYDFEAGGRMAALPPAIEAGRYALQVGWIQPHKGQRMLARVWQRLAADRVPQQAGFKLVFAGRAGPGSEEVFAFIKSDPRLAGSVIVLTDVDDALLKSLYADAAFCLYPSEYEGYGLPVVEALAHGKAVLASAVGAVPELLNGYSSFLNPHNEEAWYATIKQWIEHPETRAPFEQAIRTQFRHPTWAEAAAAFFASIGP